MAVEKGWWVETTAPGDTERTFTHTETGEVWHGPLVDTADRRRKVQVHMTLALEEGWRLAMMRDEDDEERAAAAAPDELVASALMRALQSPLWSLYGISVSVTR